MDGFRRLGISGSARLVSEFLLPQCCEPLWRAEPEDEPEPPGEGGYPPHDRVKNEDYLFYMESSVGRLSYRELGQNSTCRVV